MITRLSGLLPRRATPPAPIPAALLTAATGPAVTGPQPTAAELDAARQRLTLTADRDAWTLRHVTALVDQAATAHTHCTVVGCGICLPITEARAALQAWREAQA